MRSLKAVVLPMFLVIVPIWTGLVHGESLRDLIEGARQEGELNVMLPSTATPELIRGLEAAMNKHYGLNLRINHTGAGSYTKAASMAVTEHRTGTTPTFDATIGGATHILQMMAPGALQPINNWRELAPKGTPLDDPSIAPRVLKNIAFKFVDNFHIVVYNRNLITEAEMPKRLADFGDPKYNSRFAVPPFITTVAIAILRYDKEKVIDIYRTWGKNKPKVLSYNQGVDRVVFGEIAFMPFPNEYDYFRRQEAGDPVGLSVIQDLVPWTPRYMAARTNAPHPNAAKLWVLFNAGPEAQKLWEQEVRWINISYPEQSKGGEIKKLLEKTRADIVSWVESEEAVEKMRWFITTKEGRNYQKRFKAALHEGR